MILIMMKIAPIMDQDGRRADPTTKDRGFGASPGGECLASERKRGFS
jgi:hypothetical protein